MYKKLFKNSVLKNTNIFFLIIISVSISLFWFIFNENLSKNFLNTIEADSRQNLWWDFTIDIWNSPENIFEDFYKDFPYKNDIEIAKEFSMYSSIETERIQSVELVFITDNFPFYWELNYKEIDKSWEIIISRDFLNSDNYQKELNILWKKYKTKWVYDTLPSFIQSFLWNESIFLNISEINNSIVNENNSFIDKKYYIKLKSENRYDEINNYFENLENENLRIRDYKNGWDRFSDLIKSLRDYIWYVVLFSLLLTSSIIYLSITSFFVKERKNISIFRILWMSNKKFSSFYLLLFIFIFLISLFISIILNYIWFNLLKIYVPDASSFEIKYISLIKWWIIWIVLILLSSIIPLSRFVKKEANLWLSENFFSLSSKRDKVNMFFYFTITTFILSLLIWYTILNAIIIWLIWSIFILVFSLFINKTLNKLYKNITKLKTSLFYIFDWIRSSIKPWNMSPIISLSFFFIFSIWLFMLIFTLHFYDRLKINIQTDNNLFVLNLDEDTYEKISDNYKKDAFSIIRWRIKEINSKTLEEHLEGEPSRRFTREFNITDNPLNELKILEWEDLISWWVSLDRDFASELKIEIWDKIVFQIFWIERELEVINIRESRDRSINPFFYFQVLPRDFEKYPKEYFLSTYVKKWELEKTKKYFYDASWWLVNFIDVESILSELKQITKKIILVIISLFTYIFIFCILSIISVTIFFWESKKQNSKLYSYLWSTKKSIKIKNFSEYTFIATIMLFLSVILISIVSYIIINQNILLNFSYTLYLKSLWIIAFLYILLLWSKYLLESKKY